MESGQGAARYDTCSKSETIMAKRIDKRLICLEGVGKLERRGDRWAERKVQ
jgi:hypothetical protein